MKNRVENETVVLDGRVIVNTHHEGCLVIYRGGSAPMLRNNEFNGCTWRFEGDAGNTLSFLKSLLNAPGSREFAMQHLLGIVEESRTLQ